MRQALAALEDRLQNMAQTHHASIESLRTNLSLYVGRVQFGDERVVISKYRRPAAVLIGYREYQKLQAAQKRKAKKNNK